MATKTKPKAPPRPRGVKPIKAQPPKPGKFEAGDAVEFRFSEGNPRPEGDAVVLKADEMCKGRRMYLLDVKQIVAGEPDKIRNPSGELWAEDGELFKAGTRAKQEPSKEEAANLATEVLLAKERMKKPPAGLPEGFKDAKSATNGALLLFQDAGRDYAAFNGDAVLLAKLLRREPDQRQEVAVVTFPENHLNATIKLLVKEGHLVAVVERAIEQGPGDRKVTRIVGKEILAEETKPEAPADKGAVLSAAAVILHEETGGRCDLTMLAGKFKASARKQIAAKLLGRAPNHDEFGVSDLREQFRTLLEIEAKLTGDEADDRIAEWAQGVVKQIDAHGMARLCRVCTASQSTQRAAAEQEPGAEIATEQQDQVQPTNTGDDFMAKQATKAKRKQAKAGTHKSNGSTVHKVRDAAGQSMGTLEAAQAVLSKSRKPLDEKELTSEMKSQKLWSSDSPNTAANVRARIVKNMSQLGKKSPFKRTDDGKFTVS